MPITELRNRNQDHNTDGLAAWQRSSFSDWHLEKEAHVVCEWAGHKLQHFIKLSPENFRHLNVRIIQSKMLLEALDGDETVVFTTVPGKHLHRPREGS